MILDADELIKEIDSMPNDEFERLFKEALVCSGKYSECMMSHDSPCNFCPSCGTDGDSMCNFCPSCGTEGDSMEETLIDIKTKANIGALIEVVAIILCHNFDCPAWWMLWRLCGLLGCLAVRWWCNLKLTDSIVEIHVNGNNNEIHIR